MKVTVVLAYMLLASGASAHDQWTNGKAIPDWVKESCCGPADVHHLKPEQVHRVDDFYQVDGYKFPIPVRQALPSQDGDYWIFYRDGSNVKCPSESRGRCWNEGQSAVYCFFVPMEF